MTAAAAARAAPGEDAAALLDRLQTRAEKLEAFGPVQRAWQLSFAAIRARADSPAADQLATADAAVAAWEAAGEPYPTALALVGAAQAARLGLFDDAAA